MHLLDAFDDDQLAFLESARHDDVAALLDQAGRYVLVVDSAKKVELRRITAGVDQGRDIVVTSGLKEGELVIVEGIQKVRPGQVVTATVVPGN